MNEQFNICVSIDEDGMYVVDIPELKGCMSEGKTIGEALKNLLDAMTGYLTVQIGSVNGNLPEKTEVSPDDLSGALMRNTEALNKVYFALTNPHDYLFAEKRENAKGQTTLYTHNSQIESILDVLSQARISLDDRDKAYSLITDAMVETNSLRLTFEEIE